MKPNAIVPRSLLFSFFVCIFSVNVIIGIDTTSDANFRLVERSKRETRETKFNIPEDASGYLFQLDYSDREEKTDFYLINSSLDQFEVDDDGKVSLRQGEHLDYEDEESRFISLTVERRSVSQGTGNCILNDILSHYFSF